MVYNESEEPDLNIDPDLERLHPRTTPPRADINSLLPAMSAIAPPSTVQCGLLTIPAEIRKLIFEFLFADSSIIIRAVPNPAPKHFDDYVMQKLDLTNYPYAITMTSHQIRAETVDIMNRPTELRFIGGDAVRYVGNYFAKFSFPIFGRPIQSVLVLYDDEDNLACPEGALTLFPDLTAINICVDLANIDSNFIVSKPERLFDNLLECNDFRHSEDLWEMRDESDEDERRLGRIRTLAEIQDMAEGFALRYKDVYLYDERPDGSGLSKPHVKVVMTIPFRSDKLDKTYALITYNGAKMTSREISKEEATRGRFSQVLERHGQGIDRRKSVSLA